MVNNLISFRKYFFLNVALVYIIFSIKQKKATLPNLFCEASITVKDTKQTNEKLQTNKNTDIEF